MSDQTNKHRSYNDFDTRAIYTAQGTPSSASSWPGWRDEYSGDTVSTPITSENLNAMLNMLISIRNVIGRTTEFETKINSDDDNVTQPDEYIDKKDTSDPSVRIDRSIATYLKEAFDAIIGTEADSTGESIGRTLAGLKAYLESLDVYDTGDNLEDINKSGENKWANKITQTDGKVSIEYTQPDASHITYTKDSNSTRTNLESGKTVDDALDKLDSVIDSLSTYIKTFQGTALQDKWLPENTSSSSPRMWALTPMGGPKDGNNKTRGMQIGVATFEEPPILSATSLAWKISNINDLTPKNDHSYITLARVAELYYLDDGKYRDYIKATISGKQVTFYWTYPIYFRRVLSNGSNNIPDDPKASGGYVGVVTSQNYFDKWRAEEINSNRDTTDLSNYNGERVTKDVAIERYQNYLFACYKKICSNDPGDELLKITDIKSNYKVKFSFFSVMDNDEPLTHSLIVTRDPEGEIITGDPQYPRHAANKKYVDETIEQEIAEAAINYRLRQKKVFTLTNAENLPADGQYYTIAEIGNYYDLSKPSGKGLFYLSVRKSSGDRTTALIDIQNNVPINIDDIGVTVLSVNHRNNRPVCDTISVSYSEYQTSIDVLLKPFTRPDNQVNEYQIEITPIDFESSIQTPDNLRISTSVDRKIVNLLSHVDAIHTNLVYENINEDLDNVHHGYWFRLAVTRENVGDYNALLQIHVTRDDADTKEVTSVALVSISGSYADTPNIDIISNSSMTWGKSLEKIRVIYPKYDPNAHSTGLYAYIDLLICTKNPTSSKSLITVNVNATNSIGLNYSKKLQKLDSVPAEHQDETVYYPDKNVTGKYTHITKSFDEDLTYNFESINEAIDDEIENRKSEDEKLQTNIDTEIANRQALADYVKTFQGPDLQDKWLLENDSGSSSRIWAVTPKGFDSNTGITIGTAFFKSSPNIADEYKITNIANLEISNDETYAVLAKVADLITIHNGKYREYVKSKISGNSVTFYWTYPLYFRRLAAGTDDRDADFKSSGGNAGIITSNNYFSKWENGEINSNPDTTTTDIVTADSYKEYIVACYKDACDSQIPTDGTTLSILSLADHFRQAVKIRLSIFNVFDNEEPGAETVAMRTPGGQLVINDPVHNKHAVNKSYFIQALADKIEEEIVKARGLKSSMTWSIDKNIDSNLWPATGNHKWYSLAKTSGEQASGLFRLRVQNSRGSWTTVLFSIESNYSQTPSVTILNVQHRQGTACEAFSLVSESNGALRMDVKLKDFTRSSGDIKYSIQLDIIQGFSWEAETNLTATAASANRIAYNILDAAVEEDNNRLVTGGQVHDAILTKINSLDKSVTRPNNQFVSKVTQTDGIINVEYSQPNTDNVSANNVEIKDGENTYSNLTDALNAESSIRAEQIAEINDHIDTINDETTGIKANVIGNDSDTASSDTIKGAKKYTDNKISNLIYTDKAVDKQFVTSVSQTDGKITVARKELTSDDIPNLDVSKIDGLDETLKALQPKIFTDTDLNNIKNQKNNDIAIISSTIHGSKSSKTAYIWDQSLNNNVGAWVAFDGNYDANNVYFSKDITLAGKYTQVGNITKAENGTATLPAAGKNLSDIMQTIFTKEIKPGDDGYNIDLPSASISVSGSSENIEVGNTFTLPTATLKITDVGSYPFEPKATGITFAIDDVSLSQGSNTVKNKATLGANGTITLQATGDNTTYGDDDITFTFTGTASYGASPVTPKSNLGNEVANKKIAAGSCTVSAQTAKFKGYRKWFYGGDANTDFDSETIRALKHSTAKVSDTTFELKAASYSECSRILIAIPANESKVLKQVFLKSSSNADITSEFKKINTDAAPIEVAGYNGYNPIEYNVWEYKPASLDSTEVYTIIIG